MKYSFITLRIYKVLKQMDYFSNVVERFITLRIYKVLKHRLVKHRRNVVLSH